MIRLSGGCALSLALLLSGCVSLPTGPSVLVLPGTSKSFDQFREDDFWCRQFALGQVGGATPSSSAASSGVASAAAGTALGAAAGAALGGGQGAAVGAGAGLLTGGLAGAGAASDSGYAVQERYDMGYIQCMYAKGNRVPVSGRFADAYTQKGSAPAAPNANIPPPPPGNPPPPPPR
jgi:hypothetical protein